MMKKPSRSRSPRGLGESNTNDKPFQSGAGDNLPSGR